MTLIRNGSVIYWTSVYSVCTTTTNARDVDILTNFFYVRHLKIRVNAHFWLLK
jgi:hypothetical protein